MKFKALILLGITAYMNFSFAATWDEKLAFCNDRVRHIVHSEYEKQIAFKKCLGNSDALISRYEQQKIIDAEERRKSAAAWNKEMHKVQMERNQQQKEIEANSKKYNEKLDSIKNDPLNEIKK